LKLIESVSPPVSPKVVAAILMTQNARVTRATLLPVLGIKNSMQSVALQSVIPEPLA
jgi:hypothetical protein